jgi:hypothetical protein
MVTFDLILRLINSNLIRGSFISVMAIILANRLFSKRNNAQLSVQIVKWILISHSVLSLGYELYLILSAYIGIDVYLITDRATGLYWWAYWTMLFGNCIFPLFLLIPRLGRNIYIILLVSLLMNVGWWFEHIVIYTSIMHRDYTPESALPFLHAMLIILLQGFLVGLIIAGIGFWWEKGRKKIRLFKL